MIELVSGDMFAYEGDIRVNTVNCVGIMGKGVALAFKNRQPEMFREYEEICKQGKLKPGDLHVWKDLITGEITVNFPTKRHWKNKSRYDDVEAGLVALRDYLSQFESKVVTIPALGCGHGGLDWNRVLPMIENYLGNLNLTILVFQPSDSRQITGSSQPIVSSKKKVSEMDDVLLLTSRTRNQDEDRAIHEAISAMQNAGKSIGISAASPFVEAVAKSASEFAVAVRVWCTEDHNSRPRSIGQNVSYQLVPESKSPLDRAISKSKAVLVSDPNPIWIEKLSRGSNATPLFRVEYPSLAVRSLTESTSSLFGA